MCTPTLEAYSRNCTRNTIKIQARKPTSTRIIRLKAGMQPNARSQRSPREVKDGPSRKRHPPDKPVPRNLDICHVKPRMGSHRRDWMISTGPSDSGPTSVGAVTATTAVDLLIGLAVLALILVRQMQVRPVRARGPGLPRCCGSPRSHCTSATTTSSTAKARRLASARRRSPCTSRSPTRSSGSSSR